MCRYFKSFKDLQLPLPGRGILMKRAAACSFCQTIGQLFGFCHLRKPLHLPLVHKGPSVKPWIGACSLATGP